MITDDVEAELQSSHHPACAARSPARSRTPTRRFSCRAIRSCVKAVNDWLAPAIAAGEPRVC